MPTRYRDAVTGEYVTEREAEKRPRETVKEKDKPAPKKPPSGGKKK
ncbi:multidrug transporter [Pseudomonas sp. AP19]|nr:multidrug transporter [Pseudomonas sp. AP19]